MERSKTFDIAKGCGILLMLVGHMSNMCPIHIFIYQFHMPLFLLISGYFFNPIKHKSFSEFTKRRFRQLLIPYMGFAVIIISVSLLVDSHYNVIENLKNGVGHAIWFLVVLFFVEEIFFVLNKVNMGGVK